MLLKDSQGRVILSGNLILNENNEIYLLYRKDHKFYETPGGKIKPEECQNPKHPTTQEIKTTAQRELLEEVAGIKEVISMEYFGKIEFQTPRGRKGVAHKFITKIKGSPSPNEDIFDREKSKYLPINQLEKYPLSSDLKLLVPKLKKLL